MRSNKHPKKSRKDQDSAEMKDKKREKKSKLIKGTKSRKNMDWRDLLMEEEDHSLQDR
nr:hypothetical protein [candidate division Zixibacteria bacterium]